MMPANMREWTLKPETEAAYLLPYYLSEPDPRVRGDVGFFIAELVKNPVGRGVEEVPGVYSAHVHMTGVVVVWVLDWDAREVILAARHAPMS